MSAAVLEISGLSKSFGGLPAISEVSISVPTGERRLLLGPNGAGKTTLFKLIAGELRQDRGRVVLLGEDISALPAHSRARRGLARTFQIITLFPRDTLLHNLLLALLGRRGARWNMVRPLHHFTPELEVRAMELLCDVGLEAHAAQTLEHTSYGERRRLEIAMALAQEPRLLLLDEPLAGLSRQERAGVQEVLAAIPRSTTMIIIEHDMDVALALAERITVLHYGRVLLEGSREDVVADPRIREIYLGH